MWHPKWIAGFLWHKASAALSVKMSILLYLPALLVILVKRNGLVYTIRKMFNIFGIQAILAYPFIQEDWRAYIHSSFDFSRVFLYKWTVNWRMVPEDTFLSEGWARGLLIGHLSLLILFGLFRWCKQDGGIWIVLDRTLRRPTLPAGIVPVTPDCEFSRIPLYHLFINPGRCRYCYVHLQPNWPDICQVVTLPVLLMVCSTNTVLGLENQIPSSS